MRIFLKDLKPKDIVFNGEETAEVIRYNSFFSKTHSISFTVRFENGTWGTVSGSETTQVDIKKR